MLRRASDAERLTNEARSKRESLEKRLASVRAKLEEHRGELVPSVTEVGGAWTLKLKERLVELQLQYMDLKIQNYPPTHPKLQALENEISETKQSLTAEAEAIAKGQDVVDPLDQIAQYTRDVASLQIEIHSLRAQEQALEKIVTTYNGALQDLPEKEFRLARLKRERDANWSTYSMLRDKFAQVRLEEAENIPSMRIIDAAQVPTRPAKPNKKLNLALGLVLGVLAGFGVSFVRESSIRVVESAGEVALATGWRVLASIPRIDAVSKRAVREFGGTHLNGRDARSITRRLVSALEPQSAPAEAFRVLRTQLGFLGFGDQVRTVLVTSNRAADGKSTIAANLAIGAASSGGRTLLIDAETRRPKLHRVFGCPREPGLTDLLASQNGSPSAVLHKTAIENLELLCSGSRVSRAHDNIAPTMESLRWRLDEVRAIYNFVILDTPPILLTHDTALLSSLVDGVLLVVNSKHFDLEMLRSTKELLANARARVLGVVLNDVESLAPYKYEYYSVHE
jgi:tyrosine-protein kinase Etk/Wzc